MTLEDRVCREPHRRKQVDRLHELKPQLRRARADSQIATTLAVCELVFIALLNEIVQFSAAGACIFKTRTRKVSGCASTVVVISWPYRRIGNAY